MAAKIIKSNLRGSGNIIITNKKYLELLKTLLYIDYNKDKDIYTLAGRYSIEIEDYKENKIFVKFENTIGEIIIKNYERKENN